VDKGLQIHTCQVLGRQSSEAMSGMSIF